MAKVIDHDEIQKLKAVVGRRLRASRRAAEITELVAVEHIGHKGLTQLSLAESGDRLPTLTTLIKLCDLYGVSLDFVSGRIDDPVAELNELSQGAFVRAVSKGMRGHFELFTASLSQHMAVSVGGAREDRTDLESVVMIAHELKAGIDRVAELNPKAWEEIRGGSKLQDGITKLMRIVAGVTARMLQEKSDRLLIDRTLEIEAMEPKFEQFLLELSN